MAVRRIRRITKRDPFASIYKEIQVVDSEINHLRRHILQDYLELILCTNWQNALFEIVLYRKGGPHRDNYKQIYDDMAENGIENYSVSKLDVWQMHTLIKYEQQKKDALPKLFDSDPSKEILYEIEFIYKDRNTFAHGADCKTPDDLIHECRRELRNLKSLVSKVDYYENSIQDDKRFRFRQEKNTEINSLNEDIDLIESNYNMLLEIDSSIEAMLKSSDPSEEWPEYLKYYEIKSRKINPNLDIYSTFIIASSNAGICDAHLLAAIIFRSEGNYEEMHDRLLKYVSSTNDLNKSIANQVIDMINESRRNQQEQNSKTEQIIGQIQKQGFDVLLSEKGYECTPKQNKPVLNNKNAAQTLSSPLKPAYSVTSTISDFDIIAIENKTDKELEKELEEIKRNMTLSLCSSIALGLSSVSTAFSVSQGAPLTSTYLPFAGLGSINGQIEYNKLLKRRYDIKRELEKRHYAK